MARPHLRLGAALAVAAVAVIVPSALASEASFGPIYQTPGEGVTEMVDETPSAWFVELSGSAASFRSEAKGAGVKFTERFQYSKIWNGLSIEIGRSDLGVLSRMSSVKAVYPVLTIDAPKTTTISPELATAIAMTGADVAQSELGLTGAGVRVAVMDTGIDYNHPDLGGSGADGDPASDDGTFDGDFPNSRVVTGWDLVGDDFNASDPANQTPHPDPDPDDCQGHGTHVSGIVGASPGSPDGVTGVAPGVEFGAYRVFGCTGSTFADIMLAAMERALEDDMDILNMSIGSALQTWPQYPTAAGSDALVDAGMVVVASIGNSGAEGVYSAGAPGVGNNVIGVASFDNSHVELASFTISPDDTKIGYGNAAAAPLAPTSGSLPMTRTGDQTVTDDGCEPIAADLTGQAVLIRRGTCFFHTKALNAQNAGAAAVVLYNHLPGRFSPTVAGEPAITIPVVAISNLEGELIDDRLATGPVTMTWTDETLVAMNPTGGRASSFTSYGLNAELTLKPDIGAPGGLIRSTYPLEQGSYATISGTSMSSPHVAGGAALLMEAKPDLPAKAFRTVLQNSADPVPWWANAAFIETVHRQGAGMLDIDDAALSTAMVEPGKISLGEGQGGTATLTIRNNGSSEVTYALSQQGALTTGLDTNLPGFFLPTSTVTFSAPSVTVPAGGSATVDVTVSTVAPDAAILERSVYGGYVVLTPDDDGAPLRVPYAGFQGDYQSIVALTDGHNGFPWLAKRVGEDVSDLDSFVNQPDGATYTLEDGDIPYLLVHLEHQARMIEAEIFDAETGRPPHPVFHTAWRFDFLPRNVNAGFFALPWDGTRAHSFGRGGKAADLRKVVPDGTYVLKVTALKALGDPNNPDHLETWTSPPITIDRP